MKEHTKKTHPAAPVAIPKGPEAVAREVNELRTSQSDRVKMSSAETLGRMAARGDASATAALVGVLHDTSAADISRMFAAMGLGETKSAEAVEPLVKILEDRNLPPRLRKEAAVSLGKIGDRRALEPLLRANDDPTAEVRYSAYIGLALPAFRKLTPLAPLLVKVVKDREQSQFRRARAAEHLVKYGDRAVVDPLVEVLLTEPRSPALVPESADMTARMFAAMMSKQRNVRAKIAVALGTHGDGRVVRPLLLVMTTAGDDRGFYDAGRRALNKVVKRDGLAPFLAVLKDPDAMVRLEAVSVLSEMDEVKTEPALREALKDSDERVRQAAATILNEREPRKEGGEDVSAKK